MTCERTKLHCAVWECSRFLIIKHSSSRLTRRTTMASGCCCSAACRGLDLLEFTPSVFGARTLTRRTRRLEGAPPPRRVPGMLSTGAAATSTHWRSLTSNFRRTREGHLFATVMNSNHFTIHAAEIFIDQGPWPPWPQ